MAANITFNSAPLGVLELGATYLTELAQAAQQLQNDPLADLLPQKMIPTKRVEVQMKDGNLRVTGIVAPGAPNGLNKWDRYRSFSYEPALFRRGQFVDLETVNYLSSHDPGAKAYGMELVQSQVQDLVNQGNMMLTVMRAQLLTGGINITDAETGYNISVESNIPADNEIQIGVSTGFGTDLKWADVDADIVDQLIRLKRMAKLKSLAEPDTMIVNGGVHELFLRNKKIRAILGYDNAGGDKLGFVKVENGKITEIAGIRFIYVDTLYDQDNADGSMTRKFIMPINMAVLLTTKHPMLPGQNLGYTVLAKGEHPSGGMGPWMRSWDQMAMGGPQSAPGVGMQFGMSALPVLYFPKWVHTIIIDTDTAIKAVVGSNYAA